MAFGKEMGMMGGKAKLKPSMEGKPEGKPKPEEKGEVKGEEGDGSKHFHVSHDGLSFHAHGTHEDGQKDEPMEHGTTDEVKNHMDSFFGQGDDQQQMPMHKAEPMMGGYGG